MSSTSHLKRAGTADFTYRQFTRALQRRCILYQQSISCHIGIHHQRTSIILAHGTECQSASIRGRNGEISLIIDHGSIGLSPTGNLEAAEIALTTHEHQLIPRLHFRMIATPVGKALLHIQLDTQARVSGLQGHLLV